MKAESPGINELVSADAAATVWPHFSEISTFKAGAPRAMVRGEGSYIYDADGKRYYDALSSLYCVNVGYGRRAIADAIARQAEQLCFYPMWGTVTPPSAELAARIIDLAPAGMERVFFTSGGSESIESATKLVRQYHRVRGNGAKTKLIARTGAYHGTTLGALSLTGIPNLREPFEPLLPGVFHGPRVEAYRATGSAVGHSIEQADAIGDLIVQLGPDTVAAVFVEPVQNSGGCLVAEPEYFSRLRSICDEHDVLMVSDETICSWGRLGTYFGCQALGYSPDIITTAKGLTSGYVPMGAVIASAKIVEPFDDPGVTFQHGITFGGHPVAAAAALANLDILESEDLCARAGAVGAEFRAALETLRALPIVGDVRGIGMFQAVEIVADKATKARLTPEQAAALLAVVPDGLREAGILCRALHRGAPVVQFAPMLTADPDDLRGVVDTVGEVLQSAEAAL